MPVVEEIVEGDPLIKGRPRGSPAREAAYAAIETAYALKQGDAALFGAVEEAMKAAWQEGKDGMEYHPIYKKPEEGGITMTPPAATGGYKILEAKGMWEAVRAGTIALPSAFVVMKPDGKDITQAIAVCFSREDAEAVKKALEKP